MFFFVNSNIVFNDHEAKIVSSSRIEVIKMLIDRQYWVTISKWSDIDDRVSSFLETKSMTLIEFAFFMANIGDINIGRLKGA